MTGSLAVVDANLVIKAVIANPLQERHRALIGRLLSEGCRLIAPTLWTYETTSAVCKAVHFEQLTLSQGQRALVDIATLGVDLITPDSIQTQRAFDWTLRLRRAAAYDSYYLALAETMGCDLWTADLRLFNAANLPWVRTVANDA